MTGERGSLRREHRHLTLTLETMNEALQMIGSGCPAIDEHDAYVRSHPRDHQSRDSATAAEVDDRPRDVAQRGKECPAVLDDLGDRRTPEHAKTLGRDQRVDQRDVVEVLTGGFRRG